MKVKDLRPNPENPRTISEPKLAMLKAALEEFGDLGGFVFNRKTKQLVGGHQRAKLFDKKTEITFTKKHDKPTRTGTVAEGYILFAGERFRYREVDWSIAKEKAANIAANKGAGEWNMPKLAEWVSDLATVDFNLDLTMFDQDEVDGIFATCVKDDARSASGKEETPDEEPLRGGTQRVILFFENDQYERLNRLSTLLMEIRKVDDMSGLFLDLVEHAAAAHAGIQPDQKKRRKEKPAVQAKSRAM